MASFEPLVLIDLSSSDDEEDEVINKGVDKKMALSSFRKPKGISVMEVLTKEEKTRDDDECCILIFDPFDSYTTDLNRRLCLDNHLKFNAEADEELAILAERGQVACKDYPHSRHHCGEYLFDRTPHERCCAQCYCYVCDVPAPCMFWKENSSGHCHATDKEEKWENLRFSTRMKKNRK